MNRFPTKSSMIFIASEVIVRLLGLLFAARLLPLFGAKTTTEFRMLLPMLTVGLAFTTIGIPQALTRLIANHQAKKTPYSLRDLLTTAWIQAGLWVTVFVLVFFELNRGRLWQPPWPSLSPGTFTLVVVLTLVLCINGPLRGVLFGLGSTVLPAIASILDIAVRLMCILALKHAPAEGFSLNTLLAITVVGETAILLFFTLTFRLKTSSSPSQSDKRAEGTRAFDLFRLAMGSTVQATVAGLGYAVELPLAIRLLNQGLNPADSVQILACYAVVGIPVLCTPMVITDGIATALFPSTARNQLENSRLVGHYVNQVLRVVFLVAVPFMVTLWVAGPNIVSWFGLTQGASQIGLLALSAIPLYLQAPLAAILLARGQTRHVIAAGTLADGCRLFVLWVCIHQFRMAGSALAAAFGISNALYTALLLFRLNMYVKIRIPWRVLWHAGQNAIIMGATLLVAIHSRTYSLRTQPVAWSLIALLLVLTVNLLNGELSSRQTHTEGLEPLPTGLLGRKSP